MTTTEPDRAQRPRRARRALLAVAAAALLALGAGCGGGDELDDAVTEAADAVTEAADATGAAFAAYFAGDWPLFAREAHRANAAYYLAEVLLERACPTNGASLMGAAGDVMTQVISSALGAAALDAVIVAEAGLEDRWSAIVRGGAYSDLAQAGDDLIAGWERDELCLTLTRESVPLWCRTWANAPTGELTTTEIDAVSRYCDR